MRSRSRQLFQDARRYMPGGVNSPVRAFRAVGGVPKFIMEGRGAYLRDIDEKRYLDFCASWGPLILGHACPKVVNAVSRQIRKGMSFGAPHEGEVQLAKLIRRAFPSIQKMRLTSSGTEAVMSAIRLARGFTGREKILKCSGCYHGHADSLLVQAGSGGATFGIPNSAGVPKELARLTLTVPFNDREALSYIMKREGRQIAAFILEPVPANIGVLLPVPGYLESARKLTKSYGVLLVFDEVISGFRIARGGAQEYFHVRPDLTCLGKIVGGGLPIGVFGGRSDIMDCLAPQGPVYQAGTLSGNPLATAAGIATLEELYAQDFYQRLNVKSLEFFERLDAAIEENNLPVTLNRIGSMFTLFFTGQAVFDEQSAKTSDAKRYAVFFHSLLKAGVYFSPSQFETNFISHAMTGRDLKKAISAIRKAAVQACFGKRM